MSDVLVVGGGVIGVSVAFRASQAGAKVTLIDAGRPGQGASAVGFGSIFASNKNDRDYFQLNVAGMGEHTRLGNELGNAPWLHQVGSVQWEREGGVRDYVGQFESITEVAARLRSWGYRAETLPGKDLKYLEPDVVLPPGLEEFVYYPDEGYVDPVLYIGHLLGRARDFGAAIRPECAVTGFIREDDKIIGVETSTGENLYADTVVLCTGQWTDQVAELAGFDFPMSPWIGITYISTPVAARLNTVVRDGVSAFRPDGAGRVFMHHNDFDDLIDPNDPKDSSPEAKADLVRQVAEVLPAMQHASIESARIAVRPVPGGDHNSVIGPAPGTEGLYFVVSHSGINLAPLLGRLAAEEILTGTRHERLKRFRPDRMVTRA